MVTAFFHPHILSSAFYHQHFIIRHPPPSGLRFRETLKDHDVFVFILPDMFHIAKCIWKTIGINTKIARHAWLIILACQNFTLEGGNDENTCLTVNYYRQLLHNPYSPTFVSYLVVGVVVCLEVCHGGAFVPPAGSTMRDRSRWLSQTKDTLALQVGGWP